MSESDAKRMRTDSGMRPVTVEERLHRLSLEVEAITVSAHMETLVPEAGISDMGK